MPVLAAILKEARLMVSNDSGPAHLSAAVGTPVISIFGRKQKGLSSKRWRPMGKTSGFLQKDAGCVICLADACSIDFECLKILKPHEVMTKIEEFMYETMAVS